MQHEVTITGIDGCQAVGFLAGLGLLRVLNEDAGTPARLSWNTRRGGPWGQPVITSALPDIAVIAETVNDCIAAIPADQVLPGVAVNWPPPKIGARGGDPAVPLLADVRSVVRSLATDPAALRWFSACIDHHSGITGDTDASQTTVTRSPYIHRRGQQTIRSFFAQSLDFLRRRPEYVEKGLATANLYAPGLTGEGLDYRSYHLLDSAGPGPAEAMPVVTWLATMALPLVPVIHAVYGSSHGLARCWYQDPEHPGAGRRMSWPLWTQPLGIPQVTALLSSPAMDPYQDSPERRWWLDVEALEELGVGVFQVRAAGRRPISGLKYDRPLTPIDPPMVEIGRPPIQ